MALGTRGVAHVLANRAKINAGRSETVVLVTHSPGVDGYAAVAGCLWFDADRVPSLTSNRVGEVARVPWDAVCILPHAQAVPADLVAVARTATATAAGVSAATNAGLLYTILETRRLGVGTRGDGGGTNSGDRWIVKLRQRRN